MKKIAILLFIVLLAFSACTVNDRAYSNNAGNVNQFEATQELKKFNSRQEIIDYLEASQINRPYDLFAMRGGMGAGLMAMDAIAEAAPSVAKSSDDSGQSASDYSQTNVQVAGVDEADFIKNDYKYIYMIVQNQLVIADVFPAEDAKVVSETKIKGSPVELFVNKDRLVVFTNDNDEVYGFSEYDYLPRPIYKQKTHALLFDISDRENPELIKDYDLKGYYVTSRMIGSFVYLIAQDNVYYWNRVVDLPVVMESSSGVSKMVVSPDIYYFDNPELNYNFNTIMSINLFDEDAIEAETFMMGYSGVVYVSENNIYITYAKNLPYRFYMEDNVDRFYDVVVPLLPASTRSAINEIKSDNSFNAAEKWDRISVELENLYNGLGDDEKEELIEEITDAVQEYEVKREEERRKTVIHRVGIDNGNIGYESRGEVKGYLLNQFSMDENDGNLRVATTFDSWTNDKPIVYNNVYVLNDELETIGKLEKIAPDERIYSTRFMGDRLYMVTFERIDPFFVIDLADPNEPEILGELKIPGFSDYLHPYDENYVIGFGKETKENEWGGISTAGLKLALFDVRDVKKPKQVAKFDIGEQGTDSEALYEHKAFLFDKEKNLLVIPVREVKGKQIYDPRYGYYRQKIWQGAYAFSLTPEDGFSLKGKITHSEAEEQEYWYYGGPSSVRRSLYMDDVLYTVSMLKIKMHDLNDLDNELNELELPYEEIRYDYPYPYFEKEVQSGSGTAPAVAVDDVVE